MTILHPTTGEEIRCCVCADVLAIPHTCVRFPSPPPSTNASADEANAVDVRREEPRFDGVCRATWGDPW